MQPPKLTLAAIAQAVGSDDSPDISLPTGPALISLKKALGEDYWHELAPQTVGLAIALSHMDEDERNCLVTAMELMRL